MATTYAITCTGCSAYEEKRVEGGSAPAFQLFRIDGATIQPCPLCGGVPEASHHSS